MSTSSPSSPTVFSHIKSFVRRGRITNSQGAALKKYQSEYLLPLPEQPYAWGDCFPKEQPICMEIGFGMGEALFERASAEPHTNFIGVEVHRPGVGQLMQKLHEAGLTNVRIMNEDIHRVLNAALPAASLDSVCIFFPDPWPKKRHHKRRLVQSDFIAKLHRFLKPQGQLFLATDWAPYAQHMLAVMSAAPGWKNLAPEGGFSNRAPFRALTKFEQRGLRLSHDIYDLHYQREECA